MPPRDPCRGALVRAVVVRRRGRRAGRRADELRAGALAAAPTPHAPVPVPRASAGRTRPTSALSGRAAGDRCGASRLRREAFSGRGQPVLIEMVRATRPAIGTVLTPARLFGSITVASRNAWPSPTERDRPSRGRRASSLPHQERRSGHGVRVRLDLYAGWSDSAITLVERQRPPVDRTQRHERVANGARIVPVGHEPVHEPAERQSGARSRASQRRAPAAASAEAPARSRGSRTACTGRHERLRILRCALPWSHSSAASRSVVAFGA